MAVYDLEEIMKEKAGNAYTRLPKFIKKALLAIIKKIVHLDDVNGFFEENPGVSGVEFTEKVLEMSEYGYELSKSDKAKIPARGRVIIIANHPLGGLDGVALYNAVSKVRKDVRMLSNDVLASMPGTEEVFLPVDVITRKSMLKNMRKLKEAFEKEMALIFFPAGKVSRLSKKGIKDTGWFNGAIKFAEMYKTPVLPMHLKGRNSIFFYIMSTLKDQLGPFMLPRELFNKQGKKLEITVGELIPAKIFESKSLSNNRKTDMLKEHVYALPDNPERHLILENNIIDSLSPDEIEKELDAHAELLGSSGENVKIFLVKYQDSPKLMDELFRLREITFRSVGEGTGKPKDTDRYDPYYDHIVLWHAANRDIIGAYRLGYTKDIYAKYGYEGLYNDQTYYFEKEFDEILNSAIEVGRSFIQRKYWRSNALDYLWSGIGIFLKKHPDVRYLFGAVSMSDALSEKARSLIVAYYKKWYRGKENYCHEKDPFVIQEKYHDDIEEMLSGGDHKSDFRNLKKVLSDIGESVPVLYRRYSEMTEYGGAKYYGFANNPNFNNAIDSLIIVDLKQLRESLRKRYFGNSGFVRQATDD